MDVNISSELQKNIRAKIRSEYNDKTFDQHELLGIMNTLVNDNNSNEQVENTVAFVIQYLYYNEKMGGYYFNLKRKEIKTKEPFMETFYINNINLNKSEQITDMNVDQPVEPVTNQPSEPVVDQPVEPVVDQSSEPVIDQKTVNQSELVKDVQNKVEEDVFDEPIDQAKDDLNSLSSNELSNAHDSEDSVLESDKNTESESSLLNNEVEVEEEDNESLLESSESTLNDVYEYPREKKYDIVKTTDDINGPYGSQWVHDKQKDDIIDNILKKRAIQYDKLRAIILPEQRSDEWFEMRQTVISASDGGTVINLNKHEPQFSFILKKTVGSTFKSNEFCYHGKKLEEPATMVYAYRMNVTVEEFGLLKHSKISFLGASPDGICNRYKYDGKHKSKYVGRMLEIKCPFIRKINKTGPIKDHICPIYYWVQVQLQLECCDLEECDFWQCIIREYDNREEFIEDTDPYEPFRSIEFGLEKGCLIQLLPKDKIGDVIRGKYYQVVYEDATFIYPTEVEMTPHDCDLWIAETLAKLPITHKDYVFDRVVYWRLEDCHNVTIQRDREWFAESLPKFKQMWDYVEFFRENKDKLDILVSYIDSRTIKRNKEIMDTIDKLYRTDAPRYKRYIRKLKEDIKESKIKKDQAEKKKREEKMGYNDYMFLDSDNE
jgi:putative phage-type endonuclease